MERTYDGQWGFTRWSLSGPPAVSSSRSGSAVAGAFCLAARLACVVRGSGLPPRARLLARAWPLAPSVSSARPPGRPGALPSGLGCGRARPAGRPPGRCAGRALVGRGGGSWRVSFVPRLRGFGGGARALGLAAAFSWYGRVLLHPGPAASRLLPGSDGRCSGRPRPTVRLDSRLPGGTGLYGDGLAGLDAECGRSVRPVAVATAAETSGPA